MRRSGIGDTSELAAHTVDTSMHDISIALSSADGLRHRRIDGNARRPLGGTACT